MRVDAAFAAKIVFRRLRIPLIKTELFFTMQDLQSSQRNTRHDCPFSFAQRATTTPKVFYSVLQLDLKHDRATVAGASTPFTHSLAPKVVSRASSRFFNRAPYCRRPRVSSQAPAFGRGHMKAQYNPKGSMARETNEVLLEVRVMTDGKSTLSLWRFAALVAVFVSVVELSRRSSGRRIHPS